MKFHHRGLALLAAAGHAAHPATGQTTYLCPSAPGDTPTILSEAVPYGPSVTVRVPVVTDPHGLCTLVRHNATDGGTQRAPVVRSYVGAAGGSASGSGVGGGGAWEVGAGLFANVASGGVVVDCSDGTTCDVTLPPLSGEGQEYVLETFTHSISSEAEAARFLEQATFGPTREEIDALVGSGLDFETWVAEQMAMPPSSLREFYRTRANPKYEYSSFAGAVGAGPCDIYSRWRRYAISSKDVIIHKDKEIHKYLTIEEVAGVSGYVWKVDGQVRTVTSDAPADLNGAALALDARYMIGRRQGDTVTADCVGCPIYVNLPGEDLIEIANPAVSVSGVEGILGLDAIDLPDFGSSDLPSIESSVDYPLFGEWIKDDENALLNATTVADDNDAACDGFDHRTPVPWDGDGAHPGTFTSVFGRSADVVTGSVVELLYDRHLTLYENTVENPLPDGGGKLVLETADLEAGEWVKCHNAHRSFYNEDHCTLSYLETACAPGADPKEVVVLDESNVAGIRSLTGRQLYAVTGLTLSDVYDDTTGHDAPCADASSEQWSRWIREDDASSDPTCENEAGLGDGTIEILRDMIEGGTRVGDRNEYVVDVARYHRACDVDDRSKTRLGRVATADGACWRHVHVAERDVFDLSGADPASYTVAGDATVSFVSMDAFESYVAEDPPVIGRLGDRVEIDDSPPSPLDDPAVRDAFVTFEYNRALEPVLVCGSPNEIASDPFYGDYGFEIVTPENSGWRSVSEYELAAQRHTTWTHLAMHARDQLRMKMAWSLSQIVSVGLPNEMKFNDVPNTEAYLAFYDMFVNNGFGSYRKLMKEFSFSVIMANWLSFHDNRSLQYNINRDGVEAYPDENFAREIMQLFSVGLYQLNMDGSVVYKDNGNPADTYSIDDIVSYSRAWTGFEKRSKRGGAATSGNGFGETTLDPMRIRIDRRDWFPKTDLLGGFIGDKVALCADLAGLKHFLHRGATYRLLGASGFPEMQEDHEWWSQNPDFARLEIEPSSPLYARLCEADATTGDCTLPSKVILDENLVYDDAAKMGAEYAVDTIRTVRMKVGTMPIWYEYVRQPCVEHSFYRNAKRVTQGTIRGSYEQKPSMCSNPRLEAATPMCSAPGWETAPKDGLVYCHYLGERMTYDGAVAICEANGMEQSYPWTIKTWTAGPCAHGVSSKEYRSWANAPCGLRVKVELETGQIAIVHSPGPDRGGYNNTEKHVDSTSINFFMAPWEGPAGHPTLDDCVAVSSCDVHGDGDDFCICATDTTESAVYTSLAAVSNVDELVPSLHVGAVDPAAYDDGTYADLGDCGIQGLTVHSPPGAACESLPSEAIFAFRWHGKSVFLKNVRSVVSIPESPFKFRNPVQFISLSDPEVRDAYYETDEVLNSLFHHPSHPPFMAIRVLQRFGISNPSPGFVERVTTAYKKGSFGQFGSNEYGDLGAMVAAILLDEESRSVVLDADQSSGHLREPLIKVLSFFRSSGLEYKTPLRIPTLVGTEEKIGQGSFENPSVFSFFLPEFSPPGGIQQGGLVAPESMALRSDNILFLLDAYFSTVKFGIASCHKMNSFESWHKVYPFACPNTEGDDSNSPARLSYWPQSIASVDGIIDELDVLLTAGRLQDSSRELIKSIVEPMMEDVAKAVRASQQLILSTPEYHSTNLPRKQNAARELFSYTTKPKAPYKAVVIFVMRGGCDSWNMLVPKGQCTTSDGYEEYVKARAHHAIPKTNLTSIYANDQDCAEFGVNENFPILADLYNQGQALFMANTGTLVKPMTKHDDWRGETGFKPFAHNTMKETFFTADLIGKKQRSGVMGRMLDVLKQNGLQTSANNVDSGLTMLSGDQRYNNPVFTVSRKDPAELNKYPTIENLIDAVKTLNGVGETGNSLMSEHWSSRVASALFEHEQMHDIAGIPAFEVTNYPISSNLDSSFKAIAGYMKSREYRKVNRDVFVISQGGYDMHNEDQLAEKFSEANGALDGFIQELKNQDLWNSTVIVMGSDFGRSMNPNSNGGSDHAWGGNYFMLGGSLKGGQIVGTYPAPLGPESDYWVKRGRWIPSTPWEAVWNAVAQWMGVHSDADLDWTLPNRESFGNCDLFTDKDLFHDGACECIQESTVCDDITYSPTSMPTESPSYGPTGNPSTPPTAEPTKSPSESPSLSPTGNPTADLPDDGMLVSTIFTLGSSTTNIGCANNPNTWKARDATTDQFYCDRSDTHNSSLSIGTTGIMVTPEHGKLSIAKALRVYTSKRRQDHDPASYVLEGRIDSTAPWVEISEGELPLIAEGLGRNPEGLPINSTYESGDSNLFYTEVHFHSNAAAYFEYRLTFPETRDPTAGTLRFAEVELPGMLLPPEPSVSPTAAPSTGPTKAPTDTPTVLPTAAPSTGPTISPTKVPTVSPTKSPSISPSVSPTANPTADLPDDGMLVSTIFTLGSSTTNIGCANNPNTWKARDTTTDQFYCDRSNVHNPSLSIYATGIMVTPEHGKLSIAKALRVYTSKRCQNCDPANYVLEGRVDSTAPWVEISEGELPLIAEGLERNPEGLSISSTYESGDSNLFYTEVHFHSNAAAYFEYRLTFPETRLKTAANMRFAEVELPGMLLPPEPSVSPTGAPSTGPTKSPSASPSMTPTAYPTANLPDDGVLVSTIFETGSPVTNFGCNNNHRNAKAIDGTTGKYVCDRTGLHDQPSGIIVSPSHSKLSIAKALRFYTQNNCNKCDPVRYILEGRVDTNSAWVAISQGDLPWINAPLGRNELELEISSTYESADENHSSTEVHFHSNRAAYLEYKLSLETRSVNHNALLFGEVELPGMLLPNV